MLPSFPLSDPGSYRASSRPPAKNRAESLRAVTSSGCQCRRSEPTPVPHHQTPAPVMAALFGYTVRVSSPWLKAQLCTERLQTECLLCKSASWFLHSPWSCSAQHTTVLAGTITTHSQHFLTHHKSFHTEAPGSGYIISFHIGPFLSEVNVPDMNVC